MRVDHVSGDDKPVFNRTSPAVRLQQPETLDGRDLFMPRIGFNWQWTPNTTVYGGWGLFGGGTPNVWISNSFYDDGVTVVQVDVHTGAPGPGRWTWAMVSTSRKACWTTRQSCAATAR